MKCSMALFSSFLNLSASLAEEKWILMKLAKSKKVRDKTHFNYLPF